MKTQYRLGLLILIVPFVPATLAAIVNLSPFDQSLLPELTALRSVPDTSLKDNSYVLAMGFLAHPEKNPQIAGEEIVETLAYRFRSGAGATLSGGSALRYTSLAGTRDV